MFPNDFNPEKKARARLREQRLREAVSRRIRPVGKEGWWDFVFDVEKADRQPKGFTERFSDNVEAINWEVELHYDMMTVRVPARSQEEATMKLNKEIVRAS